MYTHQTQQVKCLNVAGALACINSYDMACLYCFGRRRFPVFPMEHVRVHTALALNNKRKHDDKDNISASDAGCYCEGIDNTITIQTDAKRRRHNLACVCDCCIDRWFPDREDWFDMHLNRWSPVNLNRDAYGSMFHQLLDKAINTAILMRTGRYREVIVAPWSANLNIYMAEQAAVPLCKKFTLVNTFRIEDMLCVDMFCPHPYIYINYIYMLMV